MVLRVVKEDDEEEHRPSYTICNAILPARDVKSWDLFQNYYGRMGGGGGHLYIARGDHLLHSNSPSGTIQGHAVIVGLGDYL